MTTLNKNITDWLDERLVMPLNNGKWTARATVKGDTDGDPAVPHYVHGGQCNALGGWLVLDLHSAEEVCDYANKKRGIS